METIKIFLLIVALFCINGIVAQTYHYNETKTFYEDGYTYQCDTKGRSVELYNKSNKFTYAEWKFKDGSPISLEIAEGDVKLIESDNWTRPLCNSIVNSAFSTTEAKRIKGTKFQIIMTIDTSTGKVIEVQFWFLSNRPYGTIPVSVYRTIEQNLKSQVYFKLMDTGKKLNFIKRSWMHEVTK